MVSDIISQPSHRTLIMYHLLFTCLMENAAGLALFVLSVFSAAHPSQFEYLCSQELYSEKTYNSTFYLLILQQQINKSD